MNKHLLQLKQEFGKYGSWALWDENWGIEKIIAKDNFQNLIKPNIIFLGLNASLKLPDKWINYHSECLLLRERNKSWRQSPVHKLSEVLQEKEFEMLMGAYMTDIIKNYYDSGSKIVMGKIRQDKNIIPKNIKLFKNELRILSKISGSSQFHIICIGNESFKIINQIIKEKVYKIYHYANYGELKVKGRIRRNLREIIKNVR